MVKVFQGAFRQDKRGVSNEQTWEKVDGKNCKHGKGAKSTKKVKKRRLTYASYNVYIERCNFFFTFSQIQFQFHHCHFDFSFKEQEEPE